MRLKISDLAKRSGLTVRALHHYDAIGLLSPSARTDSGARQYGQQDLIRLHRIQALKALGYALPAIRTNLDDPNIKPLDIIERQIQARTNRRVLRRSCARGCNTWLPTCQRAANPPPLTG